MYVLHPQEIVDLSDQCASLGPASTALAILSRADPVASGEGLRRLTVGERDGELLALRAATFGPAIDVVSACPQCAARIEVTFTAEDVGLIGAAAATPTTVARDYSVNGLEVQLRPVTAGDLADVENCRTVDDVRDLLLARCVLAVDGVSGLPPPSDCADAIEAVLQEIDPGADVGLDLTCPDCGHRWSELVDAPALLRDTILAAAPRFLAEVAEIARAYHWSEKDILAMPAERRRFYLEAARL